MTSVGAYSIKFQNLEKERLKQIRERERMKRDKAQFYSKQTAQRQKALEEKKRAMAIAEDDRRRRALEERRETQKEATNRFKSALSRIKASTKGQGQPKSTSTTIEFHLLDKANANMRVNASSQSQANKPTKDDPSKRVVLGKEVEVNKPNSDSCQLHESGLQNRTPSLDDVLRQIQGEGTTAPNGAFPSSQGKLHLHQRTPTMWSITQQNKQLGSFGGPGKSASDPSLTFTADNYRAKKNSHSSMQPSSHCNSIKENTCTDSHIPSFLATHNLHFDTHSEFQTEGPQTTQLPDHSVSKMLENMPVFSPDSFSNGLPSDSSSDGLLSPDLDDSLELSDPAVTFTVGDKQLHSSCNKTDQSQTNRERNNENIIKDQQSHLGHQSICVSEVEDSSSNGSMEEYDTRSGPTPNISQVQKQNKTENKKQPENPNSRPIVHSSSEPWSVKRQSQYSVTDDTKETKSAGKIVGILKKSGSVGSSVAQSESDTSSIDRGQDVETAGDMGQHHCDGKTETKKKVRFIDQIELRIPNAKNSVRSENGFIDSARIELWKRVLPNGLSSNYLPNSAFTPKMKVSLSSKPSESQAISGPPLKPPPNGITIHTPVNESSNQSTTCDHSPAEITTIPTSGTNPSVNEKSNSNSNTSLQPEKSLPGSRISSNRQFPVTTHSSGTNGSSKLQESGQVALDKTPTDDDINNLWEQIRSNLQDNRKVSIPPQVFNFRVQPDNVPYNHQAYENYLSVEQRGKHGPSPSEFSQRSLNAERTNSKSGEVAMPQRQVLTRQAKPSRPMRCEKSQTLLLEKRGPSYVTTYPGASRQNHSVFSTRTHSNVQTSSKEPEVGSRTATNNFGRIQTALSIEEQRLMSSIQALDRKIKDHMTKAPRGSQFDIPEPPTPEFYPHHPSSPTPALRHRPYFKPAQNHSYSSSIGSQAKGYGNLQKQRTQSTSSNTQAATSTASHNGRVLHRQPLY